MKKLLIIALYFLISCGQSATEPNNNQNNESSGSRLINIEPEKTYEVIIGSKVINTKGMDITNNWISYIGGKKLDSSYNRYFTNTTGDYWEEDYSTAQARAELFGVGIKKENNIQYLMGIYYNNKILGAGFSQYMLIYIDSNGNERGYFGGGADKNKKPDTSTIWTHYSGYLNPLGKLLDY